MCYSHPPKYVVPRLRHLPSVRRQVRKLVLSMLMMSSGRWTPMTSSSRSTTLLEFRSKAPCRKLSLRSGPWRFGSWLRRSDWLKVASGCSRTLIGTSGEQQHLDTVLWGCLLAVRRYCRWRGPCLATAELFISLSRLHGHLCSSFVISYFLQIFLTYKCACSWSKQTMWNQPPQLNAASVGQSVSLYVIATKMFREPPVTQRHVMTTFFLIQDKPLCFYNIKNIMNTYFIL